MTYLNFTGFVNMLRAMGKPVHKRLAEYLEKKFIEFVVWL